MCIRDRFGSDSYPTAIYFHYAYNGTQIGAPYDATTTVYGPVDMVFGDKNLPYLHGMYDPTCTCLLYTSRCV